MKCRIYKCKARCCYNVPFANGELEKYADKIVNKVLLTENPPMLHGAILPWTDPNWLKNKCPFLRNDHLCNIYEHRPEICRSFGEIVALKCKDRKL